MYVTWQSLTIDFCTMKKFLIALSFGLMSLSTQAQEPQNAQCLARMKKGVFKLQSSESVEVIRTSKEYVEVYGDGNSKLFHSITWENDSTYVLTMKRAVNTVPCLKVGEQVRTTIRGCKHDRYATYSVSESCGMSQEVYVKDFMTKVPRTGKQ